jgi:hypothetical protein
VPNNSSRGADASPSCLAQNPAALQRFLTDKGIEYLRLGPSNSTSLTTPCVPHSKPPCDVNRFLTDKGIEYLRLEPLNLQYLTHNLLCLPPLPANRFLTDKGIEYLREYLNLPADVVPATLTKSARPAGEN